MVSMPAPNTVAVVLAVKRLDAAKSRLATAVTSDDRRRALVAAMLADTLLAVREAGVGDVVVVSPDPRVASLARDVGARTIAEPEPGPLSPLNAALSHGLAAAATGGTAVAALQADLAALDAATLTEVFNEATAVLADGAVAAFVADRGGDGTALLVLPAGSAFEPRFGPDSASAHRDAGAVELDPERRRWARLRTDVDTPADLAVVAGLGPGPHTRDALSSGHRASDEIDDRSDTNRSNLQRRRDSDSEIVHN